MTRVLIADSPDGVTNLERILGQGHELVVANEMTTALAALKKQVFDLIVVGVHFDDSRMFELIPKIHLISQNADTPVITFCTRDTEMTRLMHDSLEFTSKAMGAWMYLDQHKYNVQQDPDAELKRVIERCLTQGKRQITQSARIDVQQQREEIQRLRSQLLAEEWSIQLEDRLGDLRRKLAHVLLELSNLHLSNIAQQEGIETSRELKDRVSNHVVTDENSLARKERGQMSSEAAQLADEQVLSEKEEEKGKIGRHKLTGDQLKKKPEGGQSNGN